MSDTEVADSGEKGPISLIYGPGPQPGVSYPLNVKYCGGERDVRSHHQHPGWSCAKPVQNWFRLRLESDVVCSWRRLHCGTLSICEPTTYAVYKRTTHDALKEDHPEVVIETRPPTIILLFSLLPSPGVLRVRGDEGRMQEVDRGERPRTAREPAGLHIITIYRTLPQYDNPDFAGQLGGVSEETTHGATSEEHPRFMVEVRPPTMRPSTCTTVNIFRFLRPTTVTRRSTRRGEERAASRPRSVLSTVRRPPTMFYIRTTHDGFYQTTTQYGDYIRKRT